MSYMEIYMYTVHGTSKCGVPAAEMRTPRYTKHFLQVLNAKQLQCTSPYPCRYLVNLESGHSASCQLALHNTITNAVK